MTVQAINLDKNIDEMTETEKALFALEAAGESARQRLFALVINRFTELQAEDRQFSQQTLANRMNLTRSQISRWMKEPSNMTVGSAAMLLSAMGRHLELQAVSVA